MYASEQLKSEPSGIQRFPPLRRVHSTPHRSSQPQLSDRFFPPSRNPLPSFSRISQKPLRNRFRLFPRPPSFSHFSRFSREIFPKNFVRSQSLPTFPHIVFTEESYKSPLQTLHPRQPFIINPPQPRHSCDSAATVPRQTHSNPKTPPLQTVTKKILKSELSRFVIRALSFICHLAFVICHSPAPSCPTPPSAL
jgi:hypothetical protein